jgi:hypothetical protein
LGSSKASSTTSNGSDQEESTVAEAVFCVAVCTLSDTHNKITMLTSIQNRGVLLLLLFIALLLLSRENCCWLRKTSKKDGEEGDAACKEEEEEDCLQEGTSSSLGECANGDPSSSTS